MPLRGAKRLWSARGLATAFRSLPACRSAQHVTAKLLKLRAAQDSLRAVLTALLQRVLLRQAESERKAVARPRALQSRFAAPFGSPKSTYTGKLE